jgi:hypothetical protein
MKSLFVSLFISIAVVNAQNVTVEVGGKPVGARGALNLEPGNGILETCRDEGAASNRITCAPAYNSALISTHDSVHDNENYCSSTNGTPQYTCKLPYKVITAYQTGMTFVLVADATCGASCTLNVDALGPISIKKSDGAGDPGGALVAGEPQWVFYDGHVFRLMGGETHRRVEEGDREQDARARRFIASMETVPYANMLTVETTAGDIHKTVTTNAAGNATIQAATGGLAGQHMWVIIVNDQASAKTITFGQHLRSTGPLTGTPGKAATLQFISDGTAWYEVARSTNL